MGEAFTFLLVRASEASPPLDSQEREEEQLEVQMSVMLGTTLPAAPPTYVSLPDPSGTSVLQPLWCLSLASLQRFGIHWVLPDDAEPHLIPGGTGVASNLHRSTFSWR